MTYLVATNIGFLATVKPSRNNSGIYEITTSHVLEASEYTNLLEAQHAVTRWLEANIHLTALEKYYRILTPHRNYVR